METYAAEWPASYQSFEFTFQLFNGDTGTVTPGGSDPHVIITSEDKPSLKRIVVKFCNPFGGC
jgi:hypothetical protein